MNFNAIFQNECPCKDCKKTKKECSDKLQDVVLCSEKKNA